MHKGIVVIGLLLVSALAYLFYQLSKRDTLVIAPMHRVSIPDSSWLYGSINLEQTKKDIAWSSLLNGDIFKLFKTDTNSSTLISFLKSPSDYLIIEQNKILYFSEWKNSIKYTGLLFKLKDANAIAKKYSSDSILIEKKYVYAFRTNEGLWMYNTNNLVFIASQIKDSLYSINLFSSKAPNTKEPTASDSILISSIIQTNFIPNSLMHPLLDSTRIELTLKRNNTELELDWIYQGELSNLITQSKVLLPHPKTGCYLSTTLTAKGFYEIMSAIPLLSNFYNQHQKLIDIISSTIDSNTFNIEFNGWKKIKSSYYTSVLNDEFEMVMQKKRHQFY